MGIEHLPLPLYGRPFWFQMCRVWPVDEFQISLRGRVGLGGAFLPGNPHYSYMYKARRTPPQDITLIKTKMTARNDKRFISTFLRKNSGL